MEYVSWLLSYHLDMITLSTLFDDIEIRVFGTSLYQMSLQCEGATNEMNKIILRIINPTQRQSVITQIVYHDISLWTWTYSNWYNIFHLFPTSSEYSLFIFNVGLCTAFFRIRRKQSWRQAIRRGSTPWPIHQLWDTCSPRIMAEGATTCYRSFCSRPSGERHTAAPIASLLPLR